MLISILSCTGDVPPIEGKFDKSHSSLTDIPDDIPDSATSIYLCCNYITRIRTNAFYDLPVCMTLDLRKNRIYEIEDHAFVGLATLWTLDLRSNDLTELRSKTFSGLYHLKTLTLSYNKISTIHPGALTNLSYLMHVVLINNELTTLDGEAFSDLPRPVQLSVAENPLVCDRKLCWLKQDIDNGNIPWFDCNRPICTDGTVLTNCKVEGKKLELIPLVSTRGSCLRSCGHQTFKSTRHTGHVTFPPAGQASLWGMVSPCPPSCPLVQFFSRGRVCPACVGPRYFRPPKVGWGVTAPHGGWSTSWELQATEACLSVRYSSKGSFNCKLQGFYRLTTAKQNSAYITHHNLLTLHVISNLTSYLMS